MKHSEHLNTEEVTPAGVVTETTLVEMVFPNQTNHYGTLFGGQAMALMDKAAFIVASRYARRTVVTASSEKCDFRVPVHQGQLVELIARVVDTGRTSMHVEVDLVAEDLLATDGDVADPQAARFVRARATDVDHPTRRQLRDGLVGRDGGFHLADAGRTELESRGVG